jgi:hypothetical protein
MIRIAGKTGKGEPLLLLALTQANIAQLTEGLPVLIRVQEMRSMGLPAVQVGVIYGRTEADIARELRAYGLDIPKVDGE